MGKQKSLARGIVAGIAGGLAAAWVMNLFIAGPGQVLQPEQSSAPKEEEDATMKAADAITHIATGDHLSRPEKEKAGPLVHYAFGALAGGVYGGLAEYSSTVTSGFGTSFGGVLFSGADLLAVPALELGPSPTEQAPWALATPFAAHMVYGATTELVRRVVRWMI